jgi:putative tryptophan/tyrosine transport system substrate-binding protein
MSGEIWVRWLDFFSDNLKSKIQNGKWGAIVVIGVAFAVCGAVVEAQQLKKLPRIGFLAGGSPDRNAFTQGLRERGYVEGQNIAVEWRDAEGKLDRLPDLAAELVRLKSDVIVAQSNPAVIALKQATQTIPIVMAIVGDPVGAGFIASLSKPGGNITGLSNQHQDTSGKRLEILKELNSKISRVAVLRNATIPTHSVLWKETETAAVELGVRVIAVDHRSPDEFESNFRTAVREQAAAVIVLPDPVSNVRRQLIIELAAKHRLPAMYPFPEWVYEGGLIFYGPNRADLYRRSAYYVDKILKGTKPADLPVEQPTKFELVVNLQTAKQIGLTIPQRVLGRADKVIKDAPG